MVTVQEDTETGRCSPTGLEGGREQELRNRGSLEAKKARQILPGESREKADLFQNFCPQTEKG